MLNICLPKKIMKGWVEGYIIGILTDDALGLVPIAFMPQAMATAGVAGGCATLMMNGQPAIGVDGSFIITAEQFCHSAIKKGMDPNVVITNLVITLDKSGRDWLLAHEIGHHRNGDVRFKPGTMEIDDSAGRTLEAELKADSVAAEVVGADTVAKGMTLYHCAAIGSKPMMTQEQLELFDMGMRELTTRVEAILDRDDCSLTKDDLNRFLKDRLREAGQLYSSIKLKADKPYVGRPAA